MAFAFHFRPSPKVSNLSVECHCKYTPPATAWLSLGLSDVPDLFKLNHAWRMQLLVLCRVS